MASLINIIKQISQGAEEASAPCNVLYGIVTSVDPLEITIEQKLILTSEFLVLTKNVTDYSVDVSIDWSTDNKSLNATHSHVSNVDIEEQIINLTHAHSITGTKRITIHNALKKNDAVILIQKRGGQEYIVLDKI